MAVAQLSIYYRSQLKKLEILIVSCHYILSFMNFIVNNQEMFQTTQY
jgi:hypothetical protein